MGHAAEAAGAKVRFDAGMSTNLEWLVLQDSLRFFRLAAQALQRRVYGGCTVLRLNALRIVRVPCWKFDWKLLTGMARTQHWKAVPCWSWDFAW